MRHPAVNRLSSVLPDFAAAQSGLRFDAMIRVTAHISIDEREIEESFVRASGPGGQNVNKLATAVQLRFDVRGSPSLPARRAGAARAARRRAAHPRRRAGHHRAAPSHPGAQPCRTRSTASSISSAARRSRRGRGGRPSRRRLRASAASKPRSIAPDSSDCAAPSRRSIDPTPPAGARPPLESAPLERVVHARPPAFRSHHQPHRRRRGGRAAGERGQGAGRERARCRRHAASTCSPTAAAGGSFASPTTARA